MQSNNDRHASKQQIKTRIRKVKKNASKHSPHSLSRLDFDIETPNSFLVHTDIKHLVNQQTFASLPLDHQMQLMKLLPRCDKPTTPNCTVRLTSEALNNEFFAKACSDWKRKLGEGKFTPENQILAKMEQEREQARMDPWKLKHFEPFWGQKQLEDILDVSPTAVSPHELNGSACDGELNETPSAEPVCQSTVDPPARCAIQSSTACKQTDAETSQILSALLALHKNAMPSFGNSVKSPPSAAASDLDSERLSSHSSSSSCHTVISSSSNCVQGTEQHRSQLPVSSLDELIKKAFCKTASSTAANYTAIPPPVSRAAIPVKPSPVVFLLNSSGGIVPRFPALVDSRSLQSVPQTPVAINQLLSSLPRPFSLPHTVCSMRSTDPSSSTEHTRKRFLLGGGDEDSTRAKRPFMTSAMVTPLQTALETCIKSTPLACLSSSVPPQITAKLVPVSSNLSTPICSHNLLQVPASTPVLPACQAITAASNLAPTPTTLFSIPVQGLSGQTGCPVLLMVPPRVAPTLPVPSTQNQPASKFVCLVNPARPVHSTNANVNMKPVVESLILPQIGVGRTRLNIANPTPAIAMPHKPVAFNGIRLVRPVLANTAIGDPRKTEALYLVSLPNATPLGHPIPGRAMPSTTVSSTWSVGLSNAAVVRPSTPRPPVIPQSTIVRLSSKPNGVLPQPNTGLPGLRFLQVSSSQIPLLISSSAVVSQNSSLGITALFKSAAVGGLSLKLSQTGSTSTANPSLGSVLPAFPTQMTAAIPKSEAASNSGSTGIGILRTLLSRNSTIFSSSGESIGRSLNHLYSVNSTSFTLSPSLLSEGCSSSLEGRHVVVGSALRPSLSTPAADKVENSKCCRCGAPCVIELANSTGRARLCITCLIMS